MAGFSDYLELKTLEHVTGKTALSMPSVYLALCTAAPTDASTGATLTEAAYTGYARKAVTAGLWSAAAAGEIHNAQPVIFAACTGGTATIVGWALVDSATTGAGNVLVWGTCTPTEISVTQTPPTIAAGALSVTLD